METTITNLAARLLALDARLDAFQEQLPALTARAADLDALQAKAAMLNTKINAIPSADELKALARDAGFHSATVALGKCGLSPVAPLPVNP
jgi:prefoldin subunit 5